MSESIPSQLRKADPEVLVVPAAEVLPAVNEPKVEAVPEIVPAASTVVEASQVHGRGGIVSDRPEDRIAQVTVTTEETSIETVEPSVTAKTIRKGDVFVNPKTGARQVVEGVWKDGTVMYSKEIMPGVREPKEQGEPLHQKAFQNFEVQRKVGGATKWEPAPESEVRTQSKEYDKIFEECQRAFEAYSRVIQSDGERHYSDKALKLGERIGRVSQEIGNIDDAWMEAGVTYDDATDQKRAVLVDRLKEAVAKLPKPFLKLYPVLQRVRDEWEALNADEDNVEEGGKKPKGRIQKQRGQEKSGEGTKKTRGQRQDSRWKNQYGEGLMDGAIEGSSSANESAHTESEGERRESELRYWTDDIRAQQREREELNAHILERDLTTQWGQAMKAIDPALEKFARKPFRYISGEIEDISQQYAEWRTQLQREKASVDRLKHLEMFDQWLEKSLDTLMKYTKQYQTMLEIGRKVLKENQRQAPKTPRNKQEHGAGSRHSRGREIQNIGDKEWSQLHPEVRAVINDEMGSMRERCLGYYDSAVARLTAGGIVDPKEQHQIIVERISPVLAESISPVLAAAGVKIPEESIRAIADQQANQLLGGKYVAITYGGE